MFEKPPSNFSPEKKGPIVAAHMKSNSSFEGNSLQSKLAQKSGNNGSGNAAAYDELKKRLLSEYKKLC